MTIAFVPLRPDILPDVLRFVVVSGKQLAVGVVREDHGYSATHIATGCWGYGETIDAALKDIALMLANDAEWFCHGEGARMYLHGRAYQRRAAIQAVFGGGDG